MYCPGAAVFSWPGLVDPLLSVQELMPGSPSPSEQLKLELTTCPSVYVASSAGAAIDAVGGDATV
jgi:hypothetical protein